MLVLTAKLRLVLASLLIAGYTPWCTNAFRISNTVVASRIRGYKKNAHYLIPPWQYLDIETAPQKNPRP